MLLTKTILNSPNSMKTFYSRIFSRKTHIFFSKRIFFKNGVGYLAFILIENQHKNTKTERMNMEKMNNNPENGSGLLLYMNSSNTLNRVEQMLYRGNEKERDRRGHSRSLNLHSRPLTIQFTDSTHPLDPSLHP